MEARGAPTAEAAARPLAEICSALAAVFRRHVGRGPRKCRANWAGGDAILVMLENGYTQAEHTLREAGHREEVASARRALHAVLEPELRDIVGRATGREVLTVLGASRFDPDLSAEVFVLAPGPGRDSARAATLADARAAIVRSFDETDESAALTAESEQAVRHSARRRADRAG